MKKLILAMLAVGAVASAQAQKPGSILIYGNAGFNSYKTTDNSGFPGASDDVSKKNVWNVSPGIGYQINRFLTLGLNLGVESVKETMDNGFVTAEDKTMGFQVGPFVRMTMPLNRTFFLFNQLNASFLTGKNTIDDGINGTPDIEETYKGFGVAWFPAVGINFTKCMSLNFSYGGLGYAQKNWDLTGPAESKESAFAVTFGQQFNIGISANLGGRSSMKGRRHHMEPGMERRRMENWNDNDEDMPKREKRSSDDSSDIDE